MRHKCVLVSVVLISTLSACSTDPGQATFALALGETVRDPELLSKLCKRPVAAMEANSLRIPMPAGKAASQPGELSFAQFSSSRSMFGKDGTGRTSILYIPTSGAQCNGEMTFSFHQEASAERVGKRGVKYNSEVTLSDVVVTVK